MLLLQPDKYHVLDCDDVLLVCAHLRIYAVFDVMVQGLAVVYEPLLIGVSLCSVVFYLSPCSFKHQLVRLYAIFRLLPIHVIILDQELVPLLIPLRVAELSVVVQHRVLDSIRVRLS